MNHEPRGEPAPDNSTDDCDWLAFRYVAGEMPADEAEQFEDRLAHDQAAREAVAASVRLVGLVAAAGHMPGAASPLPIAFDTPHSGPAPVAKPVPPRWMSTVWGTAGVAAALLAAFCLWNVGDLLAPSSGLVRPDMAHGELPAGPGLLAAVWATSELGQDQLADDAGTALADPSDPDEVTIPDWLVAAVSRKSSEDGASQPPPLPQTPRRPSAGLQEN